MWLVLVEPETELFQACIKGRADNGFRDDEPVMAAVFFFTPGCRVYRFFCSVVTVAGLIMTLLLKYEMWVKFQLWDTLRRNSFD